MRISTATLAITHIFDGEEVVTCGADGQTWVATFASAGHAQLFVTEAQRLPFMDVPDPTPRRYVAKR